MNVGSRKGKRAPTRLAVQKETALARGAPRVPLLPHEHDESPEASPAAPQALEVQAHADVANGLVDTERRQDATGIFNARTPRKSQLC